LPQVSGEKKKLTGERWIVLGGRSEIVYKGKLPHTSRQKVGKAHGGTEICIHKGRKQTNVWGQGRQGGHNLGEKSVLQLREGERLLVGKGENCLVKGGGSSNKKEDVSTTIRGDSSRASG